MTMPSKSRILEYWKEGRELFDKIGFILDWGEPTCWACGKWWDTRYDVINSEATWKECCKAWGKARLQRCHIVPRSLGGSDEPSNFLLLCAECHDLAPDTIYPEMMFKWARSQCFARRDFAKFKQALQDFGADANDDELLTKINAAIESKDFWQWCKPRVGTHGNQEPPFGVHFSKSTIVAALLKFCEQRNDEEHAQRSQMLKFQQLSYAEQSEETHNVQRDL